VFARVVSPGALVHKGRFRRRRRRRHDHNGGDDEEAAWSLDLGIVLGVLAENTGKPDITPVLAQSSKSSTRGETASGKRRAGQERQTEAEITRPVA
jgi:hypothetical protein